MGHWVALWFSNMNAHRAHVGHLWWLQGRWWPQHLAVGLCSMWLQCLWEKTCCSLSHPGRRAGLF